MTRSHRCCLITTIWKLDHRLNVTLGTDIQLSLSSLSAKPLCWWKRILSYLKTQKLWSEDNLKANGWGLSSDVGSTVFSSVSHRSVTSTSHGQPLLSDICFLFMIYAPQSPAPLPKLRLTRVRMREFSQRGFKARGRSTYSTLTVLESNHPLLSTTFLFTSVQQAALIGWRMQTPVLSIECLILNGHVETAARRRFDRTAVLTHGQVRVVLLSHRAETTRTVSSLRYGCTHPQGVRTT